MAYVNFYSLSIFHLLLLLYFFMVVISPVVLIKYIQTYTYVDMCVGCVHTYIYSKGHRSSLADTEVLELFSLPLCDGIKVMVKTEGYFIAVRVLFLITFTAEYTLFYSLFIRWCVN